MKQAKEPRKGRSTRQMLSASVLLVLLALVSISAATLAWFTIADRTRVQSMGMDITTCSNLRFDLDAHSSFDAYVKTLSFEQIAARIRLDKGFDMQSKPLEPVTTDDCMTFILENGTVVQSVSGAYLEFTLHFMAARDMIVHLSSADSGRSQDGTAVSSQTASLPEAMRISFTVGDRVMIYDPGMGGTSVQSGNVRTFGLPAADNMVYNADNELFGLEKLVDQPVLVHVWLEGTDPACTDTLRGTDYSIQLRFVGTDENGNVMDEAEREDQTQQISSGS